MALAIKNMLDPDDTFDFLPKDIKQRGSAKEWDAIFHDRKNDRLIFGEVKRKVVVQDVVELRKNFNDLDQLLKPTKTDQLKRHADKPRILVLGGTIFEPKAADEALKLRKEIQARGPGYQMHICYINGSRYTLQTDEEVIKRDLSNRTFTT